VTRAAERMGAAESKSGDGLDDVQEQLKAIRAQEAILLKKMKASLFVLSQPVPESDLRSVAAGSRG
jgi:hypothetical protein